MPFSRQREVTASPTPSQVKNQLATPKGASAIESSSSSDIRKANEADDTPSADALWALTAPVIAAFARVRVARDRRQFRRSWEQRLDPKHRPALPAAVRTYDPAGDTQCVAFDLDCKKKATRATVLRDCERLTAWLSEAGCAYFVDESISGGRHVYVVLDHKISHTELAPLARVLRASGALPTLDPGPLVNLTEGCIRPPGAAHRDGGHQRLITPLAGVYRALNRRTGRGAWAAFLAQLPSPEATRRDIDLHSPAAGEDVTAGPRRPLAKSYAAIAVTGSYPVDRYPSASEARAAVLLHALCRGWTAKDINAEVRQGRWVGLSRLYREHYGQRYATTALAGDLTRAEARRQELPLHRIHTSATRPRGGGGTAARLHLRRWTAALNLAIHESRWDSQKSYGVELVLTALGDAARRTQTIYPGFGVRHLSMGTGTAVEQSGLAKTLKVLAGENDPFILLIDSDRGPDPDVYELRIPDAYLDRLPADDELPAAPIGIHPAFSLLPRPAYRLHTAMSASTEVQTPKELADAANMPLRSVYATLTELERVGLVRRHKGGTWTLGRRGLTRFARLNGIATRLHDHVRKWRQERNALRVLHGLEEIRYPSLRTVAWPGVASRSAAPPLDEQGKPPRPSTDDILHAADPPRPDWKTDVEAAALQLLREMLGATPLDPPREETG